jgi:hypothetical protein
MVASLPFRKSSESVSPAVDDQDAISALCRVTFLFVISGTCGESSSPLGLLPWHAKEAADGFAETLPFGDFGVALAAGRRLTNRSRGGGVGASARLTQ